MRFLPLSAALLASPLTLPAAERAPARPNIVFILADDLGYMDIGANNPQTFYETPNIDRLAQRGTRFTQGYSACCVCSPTRGSIMTGKYPPRFGVTDFIAGRKLDFLGGRAVRRSARRTSGITRPVTSGQGGRPRPTSGRTGMDTPGTSPAPRLRGFRP